MVAGGKNDRERDGVASIGVKHHFAISRSGRMCQNWKRARKGVRFLPRAGRNARGSIPPRVASLSLSPLSLSG